MQDKHRRDFIKTGTIAAATGAMVAQFGTVAKAAASERVRVGIVGAGGRAMSLIESFSANKSVEVVAAAAFTRFPKPRNRSNLGVQIKVKIVVEISVLWSVTFPLMALTRFVKTVLSTIHQFKEFVMSKLHEMVLFGVALLSDLGELMRINLGDAPYAQRLMAVKTYDLPRRQRTGVQFPRPALISGRWCRIGSHVKAIEQGGQP